MRKKEKRKYEKPIIKYEKVNIAVWGGSGY
jgi:hypothetical protein